MAGWARRLLVSPPVLTTGSLAAVVVAVGLLGYGASDGSAASARFVTRVEWLTWVVLAGFAVATFAVVLVLGLGAVIRPAPGWGLAGTPPRRRYGYLGAAVLLVLALTAVLLFGSEPSPAVASLPVEHMVLRTRSVVVAGFVSVIPWLTLVWLAHRECAELKESTHGLAPVDAAAPAGEQQQAVDAGRPTVDQLRRLWRLMTACVTAAAIAVVIAILTAGALRTAFTAYAPGRAGEFPGSTVLLFGALFAVLQAAIGLPLIISWRARARDLVEHLYPFRLGGARADTETADRVRLEALLHLDVALLRNPLAALGILAPLVTSVLAVFVPGLAKN